MLHIILAILKIIGIFILILLGLLLFLLVAVLAAPVSYRISGGWDGQLRLQGKINWLYHIVGISVCMNDGEPEIGISLFGRRKGSENASKKKQTSQKKKRSKRKQRQRPLAETAKLEEERSAEPWKSEEELRTAGESGLQEGSDSDDLELDWDSLLDEELKNEQPIEWTDEPSKKKRRKRKKRTSKKDAFEEDFDAEAAEDAESEEDGIIYMVRQVMDFLKQPPVKKLTGKLWRSIRRIFRHLRPSDLRLRAIVGTGDPAFTGKIMELAAVLYAFYGDQVVIVSDFDEKVLEAEFTVKGWLVPGYLLMKLLVMALRAFFSKECRSFYREIKQGFSR